MDMNDKDYISRLPEKVIHQVMHRLDVRESARTCVLSKVWNRYWSSYPNFEFFGFPVPCLNTYNEIITWLKHVVAQYNLMKKRLQKYIQRSLNIDKFKIKHNIVSREKKRNNFSQVGELIESAVLGKVKELELQYCIKGLEYDCFHFRRVIPDYYNLPPTLSSLQKFENLTSKSTLLTTGGLLDTDLRSIKLIRFPQLYKGKVSHFYQIEIESPYLQQVEVMSCHTYSGSKVKIKASSLGEFRVENSYIGNVEVEAPSFERIVIYGVDEDSFGNLLSASLLFPQLKKIWVNSCRRLSIIDLEAPHLEYFEVSSTCNRDLKINLCAPKLSTESDFAKFHNARYSL
ncbi:uncharacterized protein [Rutidosis leptorrhynchoides]|uniref:uncharacterized protein n=1 Tax=Rutidosis leptorrhynchoides TaxID=125765 RepID=UPI003A9A450C